MRQLTSRGPGRPPAAKADETRKRIVGAAREIFSERGYDGATFQAIAIRADLTRPAINHYFASKRVLYDEVADRTNELVVGAGVERARRETTLIKQIEALVTVGVEVDAHNPSTAAFLATDVLESQRHPELRRTNDAIGTAREFLIEAVGDAVLNGELAANVDVPSFAEALLLMMCGVGFYAGYVGSFQEVREIIETLRRMIYGGLWKAEV